MMSTAEMDAMRATQESLLTVSCTINRFTSVSDGMGGQTETWTAVATVGCRLNPRQTQPADATIANAPRNVSGWIITLPYGTDVHDRDRITIGARTFEVDKAMEYTPLETALRVIATEVI